MVTQNSHQHPAILITQCLQNDFVRPVGRFQSLPNSLHIGFDESKRLLGERPTEGPVARLMEWAQNYQDGLKIIHIRDWHNPTDPAQKKHLDQFGSHCIAGTVGADFAFPFQTNSGESIINASGMNDFHETELEGLLDSYKEQPIRIGIVGVWTEAKVYFLAYDIVSRYPEFEVAVCSALTAGSSRHLHFMSLEQMARVLGVQIISSVGTFFEFLTGSSPKLPASTHGERLIYELDLEMSVEDRAVFGFLFRDCKKVTGLRMDGGYSGNIVLQTHAEDLAGHEQVPAVVKIGPRDAIAREREAFERIEEVLGNSAPQIVDFSEYGNRGGIKYRYASMLTGQVTTFQKFYESAEHLEQVFKVLDTVFVEQLGRLYRARTTERLNFLAYYGFDPVFATPVKKNTESVPGVIIEGDHLRLLDEDSPITAVHSFYEKDLAQLVQQPTTATAMAFVHGDLNGKNIIIDEQANTWLIDFFHTHRGHILKDLIKLENDILFIFTGIQDRDAWVQCTEISRTLIGHNDLQLAPTMPETIKHPDLIKAFRTIVKLHGYYADLIGLARDPFPYIVARLRYAVHTLSFEESNEMQKRWALYSAALCVDELRKALSGRKELRIDFIKPEGAVLPPDLNIGLTVLPGRQDWGHTIDGDIGHIGELGISSVLSLITERELSLYGVPGLFRAYQQAGLKHLNVPIKDQGVPTFEQAEAAFKWLDEQRSRGQQVLIHCVGGLGRSGTIAAGYLVTRYGLDPSAAIALIRTCRSPRAVETSGQEEFVYALASSPFSNSS